MDLLLSDSGRRNCPFYSDRRHQSVLRRLIHPTEQNRTIIKPSSCIIIFQVPMS
ncbi:hypothetical protein ZOSMA_81G00750 [Zostera marina]|uniref:Uncharacterized protein n=1 Tax=Zostera marina TaxID=29655 RepID=A0A0K9NP52_ZOSMR|nr:hypothetical protein ZOSMA_81G00750 [Zostera marina]